MRLRPPLWTDWAAAPSTHLQLLAGGSSELAGPAQQAQQTPAERACRSGGSTPQVEGAPDERPSSRPGGALCPSCAPVCSSHPAQLESTLEEQPSELEGPLEEQPSIGTLECLPPDLRHLAARSGSPSPTLGLRTAVGGSGGGSGSPSPHAAHLRRRGGSAGSLAGSVGSDGSTTDCTIVVHNLPTFLSAREIGEFFMQ